MAGRADTLIVGAGCIGVCSAYFLAEKGAQVVVVDQGQIGGACSYGNAGIVAPSHIVPLAAPGALTRGIKWMFDPESPLYIKARSNWALFSWLWRFGVACRRAPMLKTMAVLRSWTRSSAALYEELGATYGLNFSLKHKGSLALYRSAANLDAAIEELQLLEEHGIPSKVLNYAGLREIEPNVHRHVAGGIYFPEDLHLNPFQFVCQLASHARDKGAQFLTSTEVLGFEVSQGTVTKVRTTRGDFAADHVVLAAGSWSSRLAEELGLTLPIQPAKGYSITVKSVERDESIPLLLSERKVAVTPMGGVLRFAGTLELTGLDFSINQRRVRAIQRAVGEYLDGIDKCELVEIWRGLRPLTPDGLPIVGRSRLWKNLIIATGHGMQGLALGPITGKIVAQLVLNETPCIDLAGLTQERQWLASQLLPA
jgi:D-amino-acid dehydrogenase